MHRSKKICLGHPKIEKIYFSRNWPTHDRQANSSMGLVMVIQPRTIVEGITSHTGVNIRIREIDNGTRDGYPTKDDSRRNHEPHRGQHSHTGNRYRYNYRDNVRYPRDNYSSERYSEHESGYYDDSYYDMY